MTKEAKCKFCSRLLHIEIDPALDELGIGQHLFLLACCNRCGDFRENRRKLIGSVKAVCEALKVRGYHEKDTGTREIITKLLQRYMRLIAEYRNVQVTDWDESITDSLLRNPMQYQEVINQLSRITAERQLL